MIKAEIIDYSFLVYESSSVDQVIVAIDERICRDEWEDIFEESRE